MCARHDDQESKCHAKVDSPGRSTTTLRSYRGDMGSMVPLTGRSEEDAAKLSDNNVWVTKKYKAITAVCAHVPRLLLVAPLGCTDVSS